MTKIEIVQSVLETKQDILDIQQHKVISMYEKLVMEENILNYLLLINRNGHMLWFELKHKKARFTGCDPEYLDTIFTRTIHEQYEWNLISYVRKMLTDWHTGNTYLTDIRRSLGVRLLCTCEHPPQTGITLTREQRGVLTKILKIENKRKRLAVW